MTRFNFAARLLLPSAIAAMGLATIFAAPRQVPVTAPVPNPVNYRPDTASIPLPPKARLIINNPKLKPLAEVLNGEIALLIGARLELSDGPSRPGDIIISIVSPDMAARQAVVVNDRANVYGFDYNSCARASAYLLQLITPWITDKRTPNSPRDSTFISSASFAPPALPAYSGLLIDVARKYHSISTLKQLVELCRIYQVRYLQLHLTDDQAFTFPSAAYPKLTTRNEHGGPAYTLEELRDLESYARDRAVAIVPEFEVPGHGAAMNRTMPELFKITGTKPYDHHATINFVNDNVLKALDAIVGEMCDVFQTSPYFHIGGDEADIALVDQHSDFKKAFEKYKLKGKAQQELYRNFLNQMNDIVKKHKKQTIVWEGFGRDPNTKFPVSKEIVVMGFESSYYLPENLAEDGYRVINAAWTPLYIVNEHAWDLSKLYDWNPLSFGTFSELYSKTNWHKVKKAPLVMGAQMCSWEQPQAVEVESLQYRLGAMMERLASPDKPRPFEAFWHSLPGSAIRRLLELPVRIGAETLVKRGPDEYDTPHFVDSAVVTLAADANIAGDEIRYTIGGDEPTAGSLLYQSPFTIKETSIAYAGMFRNGTRIGNCSGNIFYKVRKK
ncbi:MAG: family 20 glycosylhydrolase [Planctomycetes bacterium]|nr:family 20 glycosylhydrolase [Planctomycetota bacterium]